MYVKFPLYKLLKLYSVELQAYRKPECISYHVVNKCELCRNCVKGHVLTLALYISLLPSFHLLPNSGQNSINISQRLIYQWLPLVTYFLFCSLSFSSGVPSLRPEHMCFSLPRVEPYLSRSWEQTVGFVCGTINQLSFNKNRKPDERQREESWGVGPYLGRKKDRG